MSGILRSFLLCIPLILIFSHPALSGMPGEQLFSLQKLLPGDKTPSPEMFLFSGNKSVSDEDLLAAAEMEINSFLTAGYQRSAIDDAAYQMELDLHRLGFPDARVNYRLALEETAKKVYFMVFEGERILITNIVIKNNEAFTDEELIGLSPDLWENCRQNAPFPFVKTDIVDLEKNIRTFYRSRGYLDIRVEPHRHIPERQRIAITIGEGPRFHIEDIRFSGNPAAELVPTMPSLKEPIIGAPFTPDVKSRLRSAIYQLYQDNGYPDIHVAVTAEQDSSLATVTLDSNIQSGSKVTFGTIDIQGNSRTREPFIRSRLLFASGDTYRQSTVRESFLTLYQSGLFGRITMDFDTHEEGKVRDFHVIVEENPAQEYYLEPGWGSYETLRFAAGYRNSNLFGEGKILRLDLTVSSKGREIAAGYTNPWFFEKKLTANIPVTYSYREAPNYKQKNTSGSFYLSRQVADNISLRLGYQLASNNIWDIDAAVDKLQEETYNNATLSFQVVKDTRNDLFFPTTGYRGHCAVEFSSRALGGDLDHLRFAFGMRYFYPLSEKSILGLRYNTAIIIPVREQLGVPLSERYFNGGENSVRSFRESRLGPLDDRGNPYGGAAFNVMTIEWRRKITSTLAGSLFLDMGNISPNAATENNPAILSEGRSTLIDSTTSEFFADFRYGLGCGIQYLLPIGPLRLDFAVNPSTNQGLHETSYAIHFSIGMAF